MNNQSILVENVPIDWVIKKIKYVFDERKETNDPIQTDVLVSLTHDRGVILHSEKGDIGNKEKDDIKKYKIVHPGDIVVNSMNVIIGSSGLSDHFGLVSPVYYMLVKKDSNHDNKFFHYLFRSIVFQKSLIGVGNGILEHRMRVPIDKLGGHLIPLPSANEQKLISRYLDKKTTQIDSLVERIQNKIELLKEQRTSLINHYVTKGLDPNVEMRDSGIEWIGEIPKHWRISKLKYLISILGGGTPNTETKEYWGGNIPWVSPKDMKTSLIDTSEDYITELGLKESTTNLIEPMSLLIVFRSGILQRTIPVGSNLVPVAINQDLKAVTSKDSGFLLDFLFLWIKGNEQNLLKQWSKKGVTVESIESDYLLNSMVPIPPLDEQISMKEKLSFFDKHYSRLVELLENKIQRLIEYRQSLISSVVTGKVRVTEDMT